MVTKSIEIQIEGRNFSKLSIQPPPESHYNAIAGDLCIRQREGSVIVEPASAINLRAVVRCLIGVLASAVGWAAIVVLFRQHGSLSFANPWFLLAAALAVVVSLAAVIAPFVRQTLLARRGPAVVFDLAYHSFLFPQVGLTFSAREIRRFHYIGGHYIRRSDAANVNPDTYAVHQLFVEHQNGPHSAFTLVYLGATNNRCSFEALCRLHTTFEFVRHSWDPRPVPVDRISYLG